MGPLSVRTYQGKQLVKIHGPPAGCAKADLIYTRQPFGGYVYGALQPSTGAVLTETYSRRNADYYVDFLEKVEQWIGRTVGDWPILDSWATGQQPIIPPRLRSTSPTSDG